MYVIYINDRPLVLRASDESPYDAGSNAETHLTAHYSGKRKSLLNYADTLEKGSPKVESIELVASDLEKLWEDFRSHYRWVAAAGGVVRLADTDRILFLFRRGYWDLPKGKIDEGEDEPTAALREVEEETGVSRLKLGQELPTTYHTYRTKKEKRILKPTYWFDMQTEESDLVPEEEEGIERAEWRTLNEVLNEQQPIYQSLRHLLQRI